jgi:hypothetical protein
MKEQQLDRRTHNQPKAHFGGATAAWKSMWRRILA